MTASRRIARAAMRANPIIAAWMTAAACVYLACVGIVAMAAYTEHKRPDRPQTARDSRPRQPEIGPQPAINSGGNWVSFAIGG